MSIAPELHQLIESRASGEDARRLAIFAERLFARATPEFRERTSLEQRLAIAQAGLDFFEHREQPIALRLMTRPDDGSAVVETITYDCPFIVDSLLEYFHTIDASVRAMLHPVFRVARDPAGRIESLENGNARERAESFVHAEIEGVAVEKLEQIHSDLVQVLTEVRRTNDDFEAMTERALKICDETAAIRDLVEMRDFLRWLVHGGFVFLGYRQYRADSRGATQSLVVEHDSDLGILGEYPGARFAPPSALDKFNQSELRLLFEGPPLTVGKTNIESYVHRRRAMDSIMIRRPGPNGKAISFDRFIGLFTSKAYSEEAQHIPILREKLAQLVKAEGATPGSHDFKEIVSGFNSFPKEELFRASVDEIREQLKLLLDVKSESTVRLSVLSDPSRGQVSALVIMPREAFSAEVRVRIQAALENRLKGKLLYYHLALGEGYVARLHFAFEAESPSAAMLRKLEVEIASLARSWTDRLREHFVRKFGNGRGHTMLARWESAFTPEYKAAFDVDRAAADAEHLEKYLNDGGLEVELNQAREGGASELRMFALGEAPILSDLMPMLQNFGIRVLSEDAHRLTPIIDGKPLKATVESFLVQGPEGNPLDQLPGLSMVPEAIAAVRGDKAENDPLNALTLTAGLQWREVALMRAYLAAAFQMRLAPARPALRRVFLANPELARILVDLFLARLDPRTESVSSKAGPAKLVESKIDRPTVEQLKAKYLERLGSVDNIADDRFARAVLSMFEATVRTNYFLPIPQPDPYITLKFESAKILGLPDTAPLYEIHVNSPRMEGCHLRAGRVARGGIRYSDRPDDFRTEILSLMKTQTVKNAVIVPTGAKGGFIVKSIATRAATPNDGVEAYKTLINAMLDVTDNITDKGVVHPAGVKVLDEDGAYLVVAADKGTASFSDIANGIATERGFWLGDAFASGGEHGYDHKKMGITARGAWESAKRHLRELGRDPMHGKPVTIIGVGDMSGDVFGNGLIYSNNLKLIAAFDHRHIFIDPDPDPATSFNERKRLYELPRSSWADYNPALISKGGGVFKRGLKRIELSPEIRAAIQTDAEALDSDSLLRAILRAPVDMFYNGGIGTYVRASDESDADVGDHANDSCRITAAELRAKIVVEGGNLGFTQAARIEYALNGGMINTDAIDNSAGVDTSDHEVNLKILLEPEVKRGALTFKDRNNVLSTCTDEIAERVLRNNRDQVLSLSLEQRRSRIDAYSFLDLMQAIEERGLVRRGEASLPTREELSARRSRYPGLTRPELSFVTAFTKINLTMRLEQALLVDDPYLVGRFLKPYFPVSIGERFPEQITNHRLRRELIATRIVNELVDLMGSVFIFAMVRDHGVQAAEAIRAWIIASDIVDLHARAEHIRKQAYLMTAEAEVSAFLALERAAKSASEWVLTRAEPELAIGTAIDRFRPLFQKLNGEFEAYLVASERDRFERVYRELRAAVNEEELAHGLARLAFSDHLLSIIGLSLEHGVEVEKAASAYFGLGNAIDFATIEAALAQISTDDSWERRADRDMDQELANARAALTAYVLEHGAGPESAIDRLKNERPRQFADAQQVIADVRIAPAITIAALHVIVRSISRLAGRT